MRDRFSRGSGRRAAAALFAGVSALALVPAGATAQAVPGADTARTASSSVTLVSAAAGAAVRA
ncbi:MAG TPA: hypothetical protein VHG51_11690, partial [Longimicrobiaceae bacterium]|nr:hypothetical protein [Longimicrobiaceae bacterium]